MPLATDEFVLGYLQESQFKDALAKLEAIAKRELTAVMHEILESSMIPGGVILAVEENSGRLGCDG
jgi:hypothetical protein